MGKQKKKRKKEKKHMKWTRGTLSAQPRNQPAAQLPFLNRHPILSLLPADGWSPQYHVTVPNLQPVIPRKITASTPRFLRRQYARYLDYFDSLLHLFNPCVILSDSPLFVLTLEPPGCTNRATPCHLYR
jgi:hypothetical protein